MRDYGKVHTSFWTSQTTRLMSEDARTLAFYLITSPHGTISGVFRLPDGYVCDDLQWDAKRVEEGFAELLAKGFANRCETTKWVWINRHFEWNKPENPNQLKSAAKIALSIPDECVWKQDFMRLNADFLGIECQPLPNPSETVSQPEAVTGTVSVTGDKSSAAEKPAAAPKPKNELAKKTWDRYSAAYKHRYGVDPVRNQTVNSQVVNFCKRIGEESPDVAAFFVTLDAAYYKNQLHSTGAMLKDAEKLRTQWATGMRQEPTTSNQTIHDKRSATARAMFGDTKGGNDYGSGRIIDISPSDAAASDGPTVPADGLLVRKALA